MRKLLIFAGLAIFAVCLMLALNDSPPQPFNQPSSVPVATEAKPEERPTPVSIPMLQREYESNEVSADSYFKGRLLEVYGRVSTIRKDAFDDVVLDMNTSNRFEDVSAYLAKGEELKAAELSRGMIIAMICRGEGMVMRSALLRECRIEADPHIEPSRAELDDLTPSQWRELGYAPTPAATPTPTVQP